MLSFKNERKKKLPTLRSRVKYSTNNLYTHVNVHKYVITL